MNGRLPSKARCSMGPHLAWTANLSMLAGWIGMYLRTRRSRRARGKITRDRSHEHDCASRRGVRMSWRLLGALANPSAQTSLWPTVMREADEPVR